MKWPRLPASVPGILGPIPVRRVRDLKDEAGRLVGGKWYEDRRVIEIALGQSRASSWYFLFHEKAHADFDEFGCTFPKRYNANGENILEERACHAVATGRIRDMLSRLRGSP